jgi:uncharacterized protein YprB with RNaseH-like and TPR domain
MSTDLRDRLQRLRLGRDMAPSPPGAPAAPGRDGRGQRGPAIEDVISGRFQPTEHGEVFVSEVSYPIGHVRGGLPLADFLAHPSHLAARLARDGTLAQVDLAHTAFLDTETSGLGTAGYFAFLVGIGVFEGDVFRVRQYFMRHPGEEAALLAAIADDLAQRQALVTFNGRVFDVPLLESRFIMSRRRPPGLSTRPHLDLLHPARRMWRERLESCALAALEADVLGVRREDADVPGWQIPYLYFDYLRSGDARPMRRVLYHNGQDILSMVTLAARLCRNFGNPWTDVIDRRDLLSLARWYDDLGLADDAERAYRTLLGADGRSRIPLPQPLRMAALKGMALLLKRQERRVEALPLWEELAALMHTDALAFVELAKTYEWHVRDLERAAIWTRRGIAIIESWPPDPARQLALAELEHRLARLERKLAGIAATEDVEEPD